MKAVIQRTKASQVVVDGKVVGKISHGMVVFICFEKGDQETKIKSMVSKIINLRIYEDPITKKMSLNLGQVQGQILCISQFTLSWDGSGGHRPSFDNSMPPQMAKDYFHEFCKMLSQEASVETGIFGAEMQVSLENDGPVTILLSF